MTARPVGQHQAIAAVCGWSTRPVVDDGLALLAGGGHKGATGEIPVLQGLDDGGERFRLACPARGRSLEPGEPVPIGGGDFALSVYEHDVSLRVLRIDRRGRLEAADDLADDDPFDVSAGDLSSKLRVAVAPVSTDGYLCAWLYRQGRRQGTTCRRWGVPGTVWRSDEWMLCAGEDWTLGATPPPRKPMDAEDPMPYRLHQEQWVCRDAATGRERWRADGTSRVIAGVQGDMLVVVDLSARERERLRRTDALLDAYDNGEISLAGLDLAEAAPLTSDSRVLVLDATTGHVGSTAQVAGEVDSVASGARGVSAASSAADGTAWLHHLDYAGRIGFAHRLGAVPPPLLAGHTENGAAALEEDGADSFLVMYPWDRSEPEWRLPVQRPAVAFAPRIADARRLNIAPAIATGNRCYLRSQHTLQVVEY